ncbi:MAG: B12-binding domain-containing radical SAM protein [Methylococcales bacterium]|nr:B12-binding domain-containing radical SAM protein [Methylococcales bacterium]
MSSYSPNDKAPPISDKNTQTGSKALIVDLNNYSTFPTLAIGLLISSLRNAGFNAEVLSPLAYDVPAAEREQKENFFEHFKRSLHLSNQPRLIWIRNIARKLRIYWISRPQPVVIRETKKALDTQPDILLLSAYLQHYRTVVRLGYLAKERNIPFLLGGPVFNLQKTTEAWLNIPGLTAIVGGEVDLSLPSIVKAVVQGDDLLQFNGIILPNGQRSAPALPLRDLDSILVPDFTDFPWDRYPFRVIPIMAGRGCQWAECVFCSDVHSVSGRMFRPRSIELVLHEMEEQARRHQTNNFIFLDLKLNSYPTLWRGIIKGVQQRIPGAQWIGTVHVDGRKDNGLQKKDLRAAVASGMRRVSFGLESGSQRLLDAMKKGATVEENSRFIQDAHDAGLSVRCTMFRGFPGETAIDLELTASFLEKHLKQIDRIRINDLSIHEGTPMYNDLVAGTRLYPEIKVTHHDKINSRLQYKESQAPSKEYSRALHRTLAIVHAINMRPLRSAARAFDGLM